MALLVNLRHLDAKSLHLKGQLSLQEMEIDPLDDLIHLDQPLAYDLQVEKIDKGVLVQGALSLLLECECARCLKAYQHTLVLKHWTCHLPLEGEEAAQVTNDCVDLTPYVRDDILLGFPQQPLCEPGCKGLPGLMSDKGHGSEHQPNLSASAWAQLNKIKF